MMKKAVMLFNYDVVFIISLSRKKVKGKGHTRFFAVDKKDLLMIYSE